MRTLGAIIAAILFLSTTGSAQYQPCIKAELPPVNADLAAKQITATQAIRNRVTGEYGVRYFYKDGTSRDEFPSSRKPVVTTIAAPQPEFYQLNGGAIWQWSFYMPQKGTCVGAFASTDDSSDIWNLLVGAAAAYAGVKPPTSKGDIQILVISENQWSAFNRDSSYRAVYSSGRSYGGTFRVELSPGWYRLVISNKHSHLAAKSVAFTFGGSLPSKRP